MSQEEALTMGHKTHGGWGAAAVILLFGATPALAQQPTLSDFIPNYAGLGVGFAPEYLGSRNTEVGVAPGGRLSLGGERYVALTGTFLESNLADSSFVQLGPVLNYRFGRTDADDPQIRALGNLDPSFEIGGRFGVGYTGTGANPFRVRASITMLGDVTGNYSGVSVVPAASLWVPLSPTVVVGAGVFARYATASQNRYFFGVSNAGSAVSGLPAFEPGAGWMQYTVWPGIAWRLNENWALGAGLSYTRLMNEVSASPIVQHGSRNQLIGGVALAYTW